MELLLLEDVLSKTADITKDRGLTTESLLHETYLRIWNVIIFTDQFFHKSVGGEMMESIIT